MRSQPTRPRRGIGRCVAAVALSIALVLASAIVSRGAGDTRSSRRRLPLAATDDAPLRSLARSAGVLRQGRIEGARVAIFKRPHVLIVWAGQTPLKNYRIELGPDPFAPKERLGDGRTPEGEYFICEHRDATRFHRALLVSYPNEADAARGLSEGRIGLREALAIRRAAASRACPPQDTALGGLILIHGQHPTETAYWEEMRRATGRIAPAEIDAGDRDPNARYVLPDWTAGCIALRNQDIRELFDLLPAGTRVTIRDNY